MNPAVLVGRLLGHGWSLGSVDPLGPSDIDPDDVRDRACSVTSASRLCEPPARDDPSDPPDLPDPPDPGLASFIANLMLLVLALLLIAGLVFLLMRLRDGAFSRDEHDDEDLDDLDESLEGVLGERIVDHDSPPQAWRKRAEEHLARREYREAVRCRYRALVGDLARAGYVDEIPGRTSGEEREQVSDTVARLAVAGASANAVVDSFDEAAGLFDSAWFDDREVTERDHERFVAADRVVLEAVASGPSARRQRAGSAR